LLLLLLLLLPGDVALRGLGGVRGKCEGHILMSA
jgi:hypothetical protein